MLQSLTDAWNSLTPFGQHTVWTTVWTIAITIVLILCVAFTTLWERKVIGWMQLRRGPNRVRILGLLPGFGQPFADVVKLLTKEVVIPTNANKVLFHFAPMIALIPAFAAWAVIPLSTTIVVSKANVPAVAVVDGCLRSHHRRLGFQLEVRVSGCDALRRADGRLRNRDGICARGRDHRLTELEPW